MGLKRTIRAAMKDRGLRIPRIVMRDQDAFLRSVADTLTRDDVVLDLGAHVGLVAQELSHRAGAVHAFEPHPETFERLKHNLRHYPRVKPINAAAYDENGTARLFHEPTGTDRFTEGSTLAEGKTNISYENAFEVETIRLADYVTALDGPVRLIKMDIEGAEYRVIEDLIETGAMERISKVWVETHEDRIPALVADRERVEARIATLGLQEKFDFTWP